MNNFRKLAEITHKSYLPVFVDISKDYLDYSVGCESEDSPVPARRIAYRIGRLDQWIKELIAQHGLAGGHQLLFVCEPTGGLQYKLQLMAQRWEASVRFVDPERMYNARMITYGNAEKTDPKDPGAMHNLWLIGKSRLVEPVGQLQQSVRAVSRQYEELSQQAIRARNKIQGLLGYVFVGYHKPASFTFSRSGQAVALAFGWCPQQIIAAGYEEFGKRLKVHVRRMRWATIQALWQMAEDSLALTDPDLPDPRTEQLAWLYAHWMELEDRKEQLKAQLDHCARLYQARGWLPAECPPKISRWMLVRVIAETGPLDNFTHIRQLWAYLGLKLARRQSGKYKGHIKITKKGSPLARKLLFQICLPLVKRGGWLYPAYSKQHSAGQGKGRGIRAMTAMMRKLVAILFAMHRHQTSFDPGRLRQCESQYRSVSAV